MQPDRSARIMIYALVDPVTSAVGYIGQTVAPIKRYHQHLGAYGSSKRSQWVRGLTEAGTPPRFVPFASAETQDEADLAERFWIAHGRRVGWPLTNTHEGGEGGWKKNWRAGRQLSPEHRAKISVAITGRFYSKETRAKIGAATASRRHTSEVKAKIGASLMGRTFSDESRAKLSAAASNRSPEYLAKQRAAHLGKRHTPETIAKLSAYHATQPRSATGEYRKP